MSRYAPLLLLLAACSSSQDQPTTPEATSTAEPSASGEPAPPAPQPEARAYDTRLHGGAGVAFELGHDWKLSGEESSTLLAASPEGQAVLMFHVAAPEALGQALQAIRATLTQEVKDAYFGPVTEKKLGPLTAEYASGAGKLEGRPVELGQLLVATPTGKVLVIVAVIEAGAPAMSKKQARHTLESIRPQS